MTLAQTLWSTLCLFKEAKLDDASNVILVSSFGGCPFLVPLRFTLILNFFFLTFVVVMVGLVWFCCQCHVIIVVVVVVIIVDVVVIVLIVEKGKN